MSDSRNPEQIPPKNTDTRKMSGREDKQGGINTASRQKKPHTALPATRQAYNSTLSEQAQSLLEQKDYVNAAKAFRDAFRKKPHDRSLGIEEVKCLWRAKKWSTAKRKMKRLIRVDPCNHSIQHNMGVLFLKNNRPDRALVHLGNALQQHPENPGYAYQFALCLFNTGRGTDALPVIETAVRHKPKNLGYQTLKAKIALSENACKALSEAALKIIELTPEQANGYAFMAQALAAQVGKQKKAVTYMEKAVLFDFDNQDYKNLLLKMKNEQQETT